MTVDAAALKEYLDLFTEVTRLVWQYGTPLIITVLVIAAAVALFVLAYKGVKWLGVQIDCGLKVVVGLTRQFYARACEHLDRLDGYVETHEKSDVQIIQALAQSAETEAQVVELVKASGTTDDTRHLENAKRLQAIEDGVKLLHDSLSSMHAKSDKLDARIEVMDSQVQKIQTAIEEYKKWMAKPS